MRKHSVSDPKVDKVIVHLSTHWRNTYGGISKNVARMHDELMRRGRFASVVVTEEKTRDEPHVIQVKSGRIQLCFSTFAALKRVRPHVVHCHDNLWMGLGGILYCRLLDRRVNLVYSIHTLHDEPQFTLRSLGGLKVWLEFAGRLVLNRLICSAADKIVAVTPAAVHFLADVEKVPLSKKNIEVIPFGAEIVLPAKDEVARFRKSHGLDENKFVISTVGVFYHEWKVRGIEILLDCVQRLRTAGLDVVLLVLGVFCLSRKWRVAPVELAS